MSFATTTMFDHADAALQLSAVAAADKNNTISMMTTLLNATTSSLANASVSTAISHPHHHVEGNDLMSEFLWKTSMSHTEKWAYLVGWIAVWGAMTAVIMLKYKQQRGDEWVSRVVSTLHSVASTIVSGLVVVADSRSATLLLTVSNAIFGASPLGEYEQTFAAPTCMAHQLAIGVSIGYFLADLVGICLGSYFDALFIAHHLVSIASLAIAYFADLAGWELSVVLFLLEVSNPFMHYRWLLIADEEMAASTSTAKTVEVDVQPEEIGAINEKESTAVIVNAVQHTPLTNAFTEMWWWSFTIGRIVLATPFTVLLIADPNEFLALKIFGFCFAVMCWKFWVEMIGKRRTGEEWK